VSHAPAREPLDGVDESVVQGVLDQADEFAAVSA
jgi:hypothetical protein